jgi:hypothetical protein
MDSYVILQLVLPARLSEVTAWWEEVHRVVGDEDCTVTVIEHADGHARLTVHT